MNEAERLRTTAGDAVAPRPRQPEIPACELTGLLDLTHDAIFIRDKDGVITYWNRGAERLYGWPAEEARGKVAHELLKTIFSASLRELEAEVRRTGLWEGELLHTTKDGRQLVVASRWSAQRDELGSPLAYLVTNYDLTERKRAEEQLRESAEQMLATFESNPTMYFMVDADGIILQVNAVGAEQLGYTVPELVGQPVLKVFDERDREAVQKHAEACFQHPRQPFRWEARKVRKDGTVIWVRETANAVFLKNQLVLMVDCEDITDRKRAEDAVRQNETQLRNVIQTIPAMAFVAHIDGSTEFLNRRWVEYTGLSAEESFGNRWQATVHPDDLDAHLKKWRTSLATGQPFENEARHRSAHGQYRWFLVRAVPLRDESGEIVKWYGTLTDIQDRKQAEQRLQHENVVLREKLDQTSRFEEVVGASPALQSVLSAVSKVAPTDSTVLITGETGTGKELIARAIHKKSPRASRPFVSVNCAAVPASLITTELFGHEKGAFTGAIQRHLGKFELAEGGTIFLDEVGELPAETQIALLRVLQEKEFERVGGDHPIHANVRVIAATNRDLKAAFAAGAFRKDLYFRLSVFPIDVPPLRARKEDIPMLVEHFIERNTKTTYAGKNIRSIAKDTLELLQSYSWPGNIRELQNVIERAMIVCETEALKVDKSWLSLPVGAAQSAMGSLARRSRADEEEVIKKVLAETAGRVSGPAGAAAKLGVPASTLESKIRALRIDKRQFKKTA